MKREVAEYVARGYTCQQVVAKYQRPVGPLLPVAKWMWDHIDRFCFRFVEDRQRVECRVGHCGPSRRGSSFLDCEDDEPVNYPELTVYRGDRETTWSTVIDCLGS